VLAVPAAHRLAARETVDLASLDGEPLILFPRHLHPALHDRIIACFSAVGSTPVITLETTTKFASIALVAAGFGVAIVPASAQKQNRLGVVYRRLDSDLPMVELFLVWSRETESQALLNFVSTLRAMARKEVLDQACEPAGFLSSEPPRESGFPTQ
jgi:DNA-binding transcriptional LysR family regulator